MFVLLVIISCLTAVIQTSKVTDALKAEFQQIKYYELIHFHNLDSFTVGDATNILEFNAFNQHFKLQLTIRDNNFPLVVHHQRSPDLPSVDKHELCHYKGTVIEPSHPNHQYVSISFCSEVGVRAFISLHNDTLIIHPAAYHFNPHIEPPNGHQLHHKHLIYKYSDNFGVSSSKEIFKISSKPDIKSANIRRRLPYDEHNRVDLFILVDPSYCNEWKEKGSSWYNKMFNWIQDFVNAASDEYAHTNWDYQSGTFDIRWVRFEVVESYSGRYRQLKYDYDEDAYDNTSGGSGYRRLFKAWSDLNVNQSFDFGAIYTYYQGDCDGATWSKGICSGNRRNFMNSECTGSATKQRTLLAHELGHNLGMRHDHDCDEICSYLCDNEWIMGNGDVNQGFSSCSKQYLRDYMDASDGLQCLKKSTNTFYDSYTEDGSGNNNNVSDSTASDDCVQISSLYMNGEILNGNWNATSARFNGKKSYKHESKNLYLYQVYDDDWFWTISSNNGEGEWDYGWCSKGDIMDCSERWSGYNEEDDDCLFTQCGTLTDYLDECLVDNAYGETVCVYEDEDNYAIYEIDEARECVYKQPVFRYEEEEIVKYLHYTKDDQWVITNHYVLPFGQYMCDDADLLNCTEGKWQMEVTHEDMEEIEDNPTMKVKECPTNTAKETGETIASGVVLSIIILAIVGMLIVIGMVAIAWKKRQPFKGNLVNDVEDFNDDDDEMDVRTNTVIQ